MRTGSGAGAGAVTRTGTAGIAACSVVPVSPMGPPVWFCCPAGMYWLPEMAGMSVFAVWAMPCAIAGAIAKAMAVVTSM